MDVRATLKGGRRKGIWIRMGLESKFKFKATFFQETTMEHLLCDRYPTEGFGQTVCV